MRKFLLSLILFHAVSAGVHAEPAASLPDKLPGKLLLEDGHDGPFVTYLIDLASGTRKTLPRSQVALDRTSADRWQAAHGGGTLLRVDPIGSMAFLDGRTLRQLAAISVPDLRKAGLDPEFRSALPSPDGQLLLGYWRPNGNGKPGLYVIRRHLELVDGGSPLKYPTEGASHAVDWLPDGRYIYLAGDRLVIARPGAGIVSSSRLALPPDVDPHGATLRASPDGRHVLLALERQGKVPLGVLYTARIDGGDLRPLAVHSERVASGNVRLSMQRATWSPDGRRVAFVVRGVNPGAPGAYEACRPVRVVPFDGQVHVVDDAGGDARDTVRLPGQTKVLVACGGMAWVP